MAINRTPFNALVDDDGSGLTGSVWNKAAIQSVILDPADAAYANKYDTVVSNSNTGMQNAWAPGLSGHTYVSWYSAADMTINGIAGGVVGQRLTIRNDAGGGVIYVTHNSAAAAAGNKLSLVTTSGPTPIAGLGYASFVYQGSFWVLVAHEQGAWITPPFSAADYFSTPGSWTVAAGNVGYCKYRISGKQLTLQMYLNSTVTAGSPTQLKRNVPGGYSLVAAGGTFLGPCMMAYEAGPTTLSLVISNGTNFSMAKGYDTPAFANYTALHVSASLLFEIQ